MATLIIEIPDEQAEGLSQFCKRVGFSDFRSLAINDDEAYLARDAMNTVREQLAAAGYDPR